MGVLNYIFLQKPKLRYCLGILSVAGLWLLALNACQPTEGVAITQSFPAPDTSKIPSDSFGLMIKYGRELFLNSAYYIGPEGINGQYLGNKTTCSNCHQDAGTKPYSFNLMRAHERYPQYRAREGKVLSLAERVNNCIMRPHNGKPLPPDSREMLAFLSYLKWINSYLDDSVTSGESNLTVNLPDEAADPQTGARLYAQHCARCHGANGEGAMESNNRKFKYPPLWGAQAYQPGSSMHRLIKQAQWLKANMPYDKATWQNPFLSDKEALDIAAFVNDDRIHDRPESNSVDYPNPTEKAIDYAKGPFADHFSAMQHKFGPWKPIIAYWKQQGLDPHY